MSTYSVRMFGLSSALLATFFGGFLFASAAAADLSVSVYDGPDDIGATLISDSVSLAPGDIAYGFEIELTPTGDGVELLDIFIEDESFDLVVGFSDVSCEGGVDDSPDDSGVVCFWDPLLTGSAIISFGIVLDTVGEYTLVVITTGSSPDDEDIFEYTLDVTDEGVPFTFDAAATRDLDGNGQIDVFKLDFLSAVDAATAATSDVSIAGYTVTSVIAWDGDTSALKVFVTEGTTSDTGATPDVTASGISGTNGTEIDETTLAAADESGPVMTSAFIAEDGASIVVTFGEDIDGTTVNGTGTDFSLSENSITAADETSPGVVTLTLGATTTATTIDVTVGAEDIDDLEGNATANHTVTATEAPDTTPITITSVGLTTSATSTDSVVIGDTVTLTFVLGEASATTTVGILDESDVAVATTSTTYTAAYTVDADTAAGAVTFSISVLDEAGNETVATTTTDESSLTIVQPEEEGGGGGGGDSSIPFSISLSAADAGMNLISLPVSPSDTAIASVLSGISSSVEAVWTYIDETWYVYYPNNTELSNLTTMDAGYAYWIEVSADTTLSGSGTASTLSRTLDIGWQLVGYMQPDADTTGAVSIDTAFASVGLAGIAYGDLVGYGTGSAATPTAVNPGEGFWMNVVDPSSVIITPA